MHKWYTEVMNSAKNAEKWLRYDQLVKDHEILKSQYDLLQENYQKLLAHRIKTFVWEPVDNSGEVVDK